MINKTNVEMYLPYGKLEDNGAPIPVELQKVDLVETFWHYKRLIKK